VLVVSSQMGRHPKPLTDPVVRFGRAARQSDPNELTFPAMMVFVRVGPRHSTCLVAAPLVIAASENLHGFGL
jgi:hypothetical protein